jgi:smad nuclear-interacting protein 1
VRAKLWEMGLAADRTCADLMHIQRQSAYLVGRDKTIVDIPVDHPSCSKQHAVIQCTPTPSLPPTRVFIL